MPGLDDIDDDVPYPTATAATTTAPAATSSSPAAAGGAPTMDDIFGGLGEAPKPKPKPVAQQPAPAPVAQQQPSRASPQGGASSPAAQAAAKPSALDDFFSSPPQGASGTTSPVPGTSPPAKKSAGMSDLLGGAPATLGSAIQSDRPYVPPPGVVKLMSHYEVMSLRETCTAEEVSKAYRRLAIAFHPDKRGAELTPEEEVFFKAVTTANEVLSDAEKRAAYDAERKAAKAGGARGDDLFAHMA